jgi:hypothetical protein
VTGARGWKEYKKERPRSIDSVMGLEGVGASQHCFMSSCGTLQSLVAPCTVIKPSEQDLAEQNPRVVSEGGVQSKKVSHEQNNRAS